MMANAVHRQAPDTPLSIPACWTFCGLLFLMLASRATAQTQVHRVTPAQELSLKQLQQLLDTDEADSVNAAVQLAMQMIDETGDRVVAVEGVSPTLEGHFLPLSMVVHDRLLRSGQTRPDVLEAFRARYDRPATNALQSAQQSSSRAELSIALQRFFASSIGDALLLEYADQSLRQGLPQQAIAALVRIDSRWQPHATGQHPASIVSAIDWETLLPAIDQADLPTLQKIADETASRPGFPIGTFAGSSIPSGRIGLRLVYAYGLLGRIDTAKKLAVIVNHRAATETIRWAGRETTVAEALDRLLPQLDTWQFTHLGDSLPEGFTAAPRWHSPIPGSVSLPAESAPRWSLRSGAYRSPLQIPLVTDQLVFLHTGHELVARSVEAGWPWPPGIDYEAIYDAGTQQQTLWSPVFRLNVLPRFTLAHQGRWLAGRFGSLTAREDRFERSQAASQLVVLDLDREGALQSGYPLTAAPDHHFVGSPALHKDRLYVPLQKTDSSSQTTTIQCLDIATAAELWTSSPLVIQRRRSEVASASEVILVATADQIVCQIGNVTVALDSDRGTQQWVVTEPLRELDGKPFPAQRISNIKSPAALAVCQAMVIVAAQDVDRIYALDLHSGRLQWASPPGVADDVTQIHGIVNDQLLLSGHHVYWLQPHSGNLQATFPPLTTRQVGAAHPAYGPQASGHLFGDKLIWQQQHQVYVLDSQLDRQPDRSPLPRILSHWQLDALGLPPVIVAGSDNHLILFGSDGVFDFSPR